jgi:N-methylhydantoinase A
MTYRISVDTGGTFTDVVVAAEGKLHIGKALTTPERAFTGVMAAIRNAADAIDTSVEYVLANTDLFVYGTTRATNAIVERKIAKTAFLTTEGFPDILLFKEGGKLEAHRWDVEFPKPYIPRRWTFEIPERTSSEGAIERPLDEDATRATLKDIRSRGFQAVAVCLLFSVLNPRHELRLGELIDEVLPGAAYTLSHQLNPILREYRRASSAAIDASLAPLMRSHLSELESDLNAAGFRGQLLVSTSIGGVMRVDDAIRHPIYLTKSGPSMAPLAGYLYAAAENLGESVIVCDAGGTTFDVSLVHKGEIKFTRDTWIGGQFTGDCVGLSSVDVRSIGAGGGSIAWIDSGGLMRVGPHSAGAVPGPACYGSGGDQPTVTDAALVLGYVDPDYFLGGRMKLDIVAARAALRGIADKLGQDIETTAAGVLAIANEHMVRAIREITVNEGYDPKESTVVAGGGSCGFAIMKIAETLRCRRIVLPRTASALSACGAQFSSYAFEKTASCAARTDAFDYAQVNDALSTLAEAVEAFSRTLEERGVVEGQISFHVEARYLYEAWEIEIPIATGTFSGPEEVRALEERFHREHKRIFAVEQPGQPVECLFWKVRFSGRSELARPSASEAPDYREVETPMRRPAFFPEVGSVDVPVYFGVDLSPGAVIRGPAVIEEPTTTIVVYPSMTARIGGSDSYILETSEAPRATRSNAAEGIELDPVTLAVLANRVDGVVREMSNTLLRTGRSAVINQARDFSCSIVTGDHQLLAAAEGVPVHVFGSHLQTASVERFHKPREGDAYLHNDPYLGNTHPADHTIIAPVFCEGELMFYAVAKAHQADIGNAFPTTYAANAVDVYSEGSLVFPCVLVQRDYQEIADVVRMCRSRIRVPDQWYGDFLAAIGAARIGERSLKAFVDQYGAATVKAFVRQYFDYSERRMASAIGRLPLGVATDETRHDPTPRLLQGVPIKVTLSVDPSAGRIAVDLRDNPDCLDCGLNLSEACATSAIINGLFNCLDWDIPKNAGSFRNIDVKLRENCCVGIPTFPHSCSMATTNLTDRVVNVVQSAMAKLGDGLGLAQGGNAMGAPMAVISGRDARHNGEPFINQIFVGKNGGPGGPKADGWVTYVLPNAGGVTYRDSIELDEIKYPLRIKLQRLATDSGGAGRRRGAPSAEVVYGAKGGPMTVIIPSDGHHYPPQGVRKGRAGAAARTFLIGADGRVEQQPNVCTIELQTDQRIWAIDCGGGGYGDPLQREPERVLEDVLEKWVSVEAARDVYGVIFRETSEGDGLALDVDGTTRLRQVKAAGAAA